MYMYVMCMYMFEQSFARYLGLFGDHVVPLLCCIGIHKFFGVRILSTAKENRYLPMLGLRQCGNGWLTALQLLWLTPQ